MPNQREQKSGGACPLKQGNEEVSPSPDTDAIQQEEQLVRDAQGGDSQAMERLIELFQDRVWRRARYRIGDPDEAWEVSQDVFIICFRKIGQFRGEARFWTWLARIVDNQVRNRLGWWRRRRRAQTFSMEDMLHSRDEGDRAWDPPDPSPSPRQLVEGRQALESLEQSLGELSPDHREVLLLRFADGQSYEEVAQTLNISVGTVKSRINRARRELRKKLEPHLD